MAISLFCPACGSQMFGRAEVVPGTVTVRVGSMNASSFFAPPIAVHEKRKRHWDGPHKHPRISNAAAVV